MTKLAKLLLCLTLTLYNYNIHAAPIKIVTSTVPMASITKMLLKDKGVVESLHNSPGCPHHYALKFSDKQKLDNADYLIYIDKKFDAFAHKIVDNFDSTVIKIGDLQTINFTTESGRLDWHFWLDLDNIIALSQELSNILIQDNPHLKGDIKQNLIETIDSLQKLKQRKNKSLQNLHTILLASNSLEHFFTNSNIEVIRLPQLNHGTLQKFQELDSLLQTHPNLPIVIDLHQKPDLYKGDNRQIIQINSENWSSVKPEDSSYEIFDFVYYYDLLLDSIPRKD